MGPGGDRVWEAVCTLLWAVNMPVYSEDREGSSKPPSARPQAGATSSKELPATFPSTPNHSGGEMTTRNIGPAILN